MSEEHLQKEIELLKLKIKHLQDVIMRALPYVKAHYERSRFGMGARDLMNEMKEVLGIK